MHESFFCVFLTWPCLSVTAFRLAHCVSLCVLRKTQHQNMTMCQFRPQFASIPGNCAKPRSTERTRRHPVLNDTSMHSLVCLRRIHPCAHICLHRGIKRRRINTFFSLFFMPKLTCTHAHTPVHPIKSTISHNFMTFAIWLYNK